MYVSQLCIYIYIYIYTELGTILIQYIIETITITHFFIIINTTTITLKKIIVYYRSIYTITTTYIHFLYTNTLKLYTIYI